MSETLSLICISFLFMQSIYVMLMQIVQLSFSALNFRKKICEFRQNNVWISNKKNKWHTLRIHLLLFQLDTNRIVEMIHIRASLSGSTDVLLLSNAIKNLASNSSPSQISTSSSQQASTPVMAKNMITNASFRAKKMHTDIPKVKGEIKEVLGVSGVSNKKHVNIDNQCSDV